jgi:hypothetical protein
MNDIYTKLYKEFKEQFPYWLCFLAGVFFAFFQRIFREDPIFVGVFWFAIVISVATIFLGIWFVTTKPATRWNITARVPLIAWSLVIGSGGASLFKSFLTSQVPNNYRFLVDLCCLGIVGLFAFAFVIYAVIKRRQHDRQ